MRSMTAVLGVRTRFGPTITRKRSSDRRYSKKMQKRCTYLLPIRRASFSAAEAAELAAYFRS